MCLTHYYAYVFLTVPSSEHLQTTRNSARIMISVFDRVEIIVEKEKMLVITMFS